MFYGWYPENSLHSMRTDLRQVEAVDQEFQ